MDDRFEMARAFLAATEWAGGAVRPLAGDASSRRYFRVSLGDRNAVLMDAPPVDGQAVGPFIEIAGVLRGMGLSAPRVLAQDRARGFLLLEDLGDAVFAQVIAQDPTEEMALYEAAVDVLIYLDRQAAPGFVPRFSPRVMAAQVAPFFEWYLADQALMGAFQAGLETVLYSAWSGSSLMLRDFHAENLIWLPERPGLARVGLLDFQDAMGGPSGYDLVSLLQDARRDVSPDVTTTMITRFAQGTGRDAEQFAALYAAIGVQRNLRILGVFARLSLLHGKPRYLEFIPRVWKHAQTCLKHAALNDLAELVRQSEAEPTNALMQRLREPCAPTRP